MLQNIAEYHALTDEKGAVEARQTVDSTHSEPFPFMKLPFDVRRLIYEELYLTRQIINLSWSSEFYFGCVYALPVGSAAFLRTCRDIKEEAYDILYGMNKFVFHATVAEFSPRFAFERISLHKLEPSIRKRISHLHVILGTPINFAKKMSLLKVLPDFPKLLITVVLYLDLYDPYGFLEIRPMMLQQLGPHCKDIALARKDSGPTSWDDLGDDEISSMLKIALPKEYKESTCLIFKRWYNEKKASGEMRELGREKF